MEICPDPHIYWYIINFYSRGVARHEFTHQILADTESLFDGRRIPRDRRISIICRDMPNRSSTADTMNP